MIIIGLNIIDRLLPKIRNLDSAALGREPKLCNLSAVFPIRTYEHANSWFSLIAAVNKHTHHTVSPCGQDLREVLSVFYS